MNSDNCKSPAPRVSVVIPVFNASRYLAECLDSVLDQTFSDFEILAFDDGSTDGSIEILKRYATQDPRVNVLLRNHSGYTPHLNEGLSLAKGQYLARMDADDVCSIHRFREHVKFLYQTPNVNAVGTWYDFIDSSGRPFCSYRTPTTHYDIEKQNLLGIGGTIAHPSLMMRVDSAREIGGYRSQFEPAEDLDLLLRLGEIGELANIPLRLLAYRVHDRATSTTRRSLQLQANVSILEEAWERRRLTGLIPQQSHGSRLSPADPDFWDERYRKSIASAFFATARWYAVRQVLSQPAVVKHWTKLLKVMYSPFCHSEAECCAYTRKRCE